MSLANKLMQRTGDLLTERIGSTPLLSLDGIADEIAGETTLSAKAEFFNPGGSIQDRPALQMIIQAERTGGLRKGVRVLEEGSGNLGLSLAMIGAARGHGVTLCVPENVPEGHKAALAAFGAELVLTPAAAGFEGAAAMARDMHRKSPARWCYTDHRANPAGWQAHYRTTAVEIFRQTEGAVTHFVSGLGTGGTFVGVGRRLRELKPDIRLVRVRPEPRPPGFEEPGLDDPGLAGRTVLVRAEEAREAAVRLARELGILTGLSSGANVAAAIEVARSVPRGLVATILPDGGLRSPGDPAALGAVG